MSSFQKCVLPPFLLLSLSAGQTPSPNQWTTGNPRYTFLNLFTYSSFFRTWTKHRRHRTQFTVDYGHFPDGFSSYCFPNGLSSYSFPQSFTLWSDKVIGALCEGMKWCSHLLSRRYLQDNGLYILLNSSPSLSYKITRHPQPPKY